MHQSQNLSQRFRESQVSKTVLFWACAGSVIVTTVVGFSWGGWVTGGSARELAEDSAAQARQEVAAVVCVDRFMAAPDAGNQLSALQEITSPYAQGKFVQDGGWASIVQVGSNAESSMPMVSSDHRKAAGLCAEELAKREIPTAGNATQIREEATVAQ